LIGEPGVGKPPSSKASRNASFPATFPKPAQQTARFPRP
jgi:hypothetical protein